MLLMLGMKPFFVLTRIDILDRNKRKVRCAVSSHAEKAAAPPAAANRSSDAGSSPSRFRSGLSFNDLVSRHGATFPLDGGCHSPAPWGGYGTID